MVTLERESESKELPLQKTQRQRREKTTGCGRDDVYREKGAVPGKTTPCILALGDLADKNASPSSHTPQQLAYTASYTWLQQKSTCISPDILSHEAYSAHAYS